MWEKENFQLSLHSIMAKRLAHSTKNARVNAQKWKYRHTDSIFSYFLIVPSCLRHVVPLSLCFVLLTFLLSACSVNKFIGDDELYLKEVKVVSTNKEATKDFYLSNYVRQTPNSNWFGAKIPLKIY